MTALGMGPVEGMVVMEELGRGMVLEPLAQALIAGGVLRRLRPMCVKPPGCPKLPAAKPWWCWPTRSAQRATHSICVRQKRLQAPVGYALTAIKSIVPAGDQADAFIVPAKLNGQMALFLVERRPAASAPGATARKTAAAPPKCSFTNAPATLITQDGLAALEHAVDIGIAATCAEAVGVMDKTMATHRRVHEHRASSLAWPSAASRRCATARPT